MQREALFYLEENDACESAREMDESLELNIANSSPADRASFKLMSDEYLELRPSIVSVRNVRREIELTQAVARISSQWTLY